MLVIILSMKLSSKVLWYHEQLKNEAAGKTLWIMVLICDIMHLQGT